MSRTFMRRELRRQAPAGLGMFVLSLLLIVGTALITDGHHLDAVLGFCFLLTPALLGVYAFGPDLEAGHERFLNVLPVSRTKLGLLRLGIAAGLVASVDLGLFAISLGVGYGLEGRWLRALAEIAGLSSLLVPLGALASVATRHTLAALGTVLVLMISGPVVFDFIDELVRVELDDDLVAPSLFVGWSLAALWLYTRARSTPPLKASIPLGVAALAVGFLPVPAFGAYNYLTYESDVARYHRIAPRLQPAPTGEATAITMPDRLAAYEDAVGVLKAGEETPTRVGYGHSLWLGDWLIASSWQEESLTCYDLADDELHRYDRAIGSLYEEGDPAHDQLPEGRFSNRLSYFAPTTSGMILDRVGDELLAVPYSSRAGGGRPDFDVKLRVERGWKSDGYVVRNLTQGTTWAPPAGAAVQTLANGWALLRTRERRSSVVHLISGATFDLESDLSAELRSPWVQLVRVDQRAVLIGLTDGGSPRLWWRDLDDPSLGQTLNLKSIGVDLYSRSRVFVAVQQGYVTVRCEHGTREALAWNLDGSSLPVPLKSLPYAYGSAGSYLGLEENTARPLVLVRHGAPELRINVTEGALHDMNLSFGPGQDVRLTNESGQVFVVDDEGELELSFSIGKPETWRTLAPSARAEDR